MVADNDDLLLLLNYIDTLSPAECVFRQHSNPLQEYDEIKFRQRFRLSKSTVLSLLLEVGIIHDRFDYSNYYYGTIDRQLPCLASRAHLAPTVNKNNPPAVPRSQPLGRGVCSIAHALASHSPTPRPAACTYNVKAILHS